MGSYIQGSVLRLMNPDRLEEHDEEEQLTNPPPTTFAKYGEALQRCDMYIYYQTKSHVGISEEEELMFVAH